MHELFTAIRTSYGGYSDLGVHVALVWIAILYLYIQEGSQQKRRFLYAGILMMLILLNPFTAGKEPYDRMVAMIPTVVFIAYAMAKAVVTEREKKNRWILVSGFLIILFVSLNFHLTAGNIGLLENRYRVSDESEELHQIICQLGDVYVIAPRNVGEELREYDVTFRVLGGDEEKWRVINDISQNWSDSEKIAYYAATYNAGCVVCPKGEDGGQWLNPDTFVMIAETEHYRVYVLA